MLKENQKKANLYLSRLQEKTSFNYINGCFFEGCGELATNLTPIDNTLLNQFRYADKNQTEIAIESAKEAFLSWRDTPPEKRAKILQNVADKIVENAEEIALLESIDTGQAYRFMKKAALRGAENFRFFANKIPESSDGKSMPTSSHMNYSVRVPLGPVAVITPWNTPFMLSTWKIAPALAAGCTVIFKPSELSPLTAVVLCRILQDAGVPPGVLNMIQGTGPQIGKKLCEHPDVKAIAFVGGVNSGKLIMAQGSSTLKRIHLELGGKNPVIVFDDADLEKALDAVVFMIYSLNGERCTSSSRLLIQESLYEDFTNKVAARAEKIRIGHPLDPLTELGPLISQNHLKKVCSYFDSALEEGATIKTGGKLYNKDGGNYVHPTLFTSASAKQRIAQEEIFGPVLTAIPFKDEAHAIELANDIEYGLSGYVWTNSMERGLRMAHAIDAGMIWVNSENVRHLPAPFGGMKNSGIGRDGGDYSFDFYMETKNISLSMGKHQVPELGK